MMLNLDNELNKYANNVSEVEKGTGFAWIPRIVSGQRLDVDALAFWSRAAFCNNQRYKQSTTP